MMSTEDESAGSGGLTTELAWYDGVSGWQPISRTFIERELGKPNPDYRSLADRLAGYSAAERHAGWIGVAQSAPLRMARTRAYVEALHNDPDPTSVAWGWLDGDFDLMERVEHVLRPDDPHTPEMVEALRDRLGSILDAGGAEMPAAAEAEPAEVTADEPAARAEPVEAVTASDSDSDPAASAPSGEEPAGPAADTPDTAAADQAWAQLTASDPVPAAQPEAHPAVQHAAAASAGPIPSAEPAPAPSPAPGWLPTHYVPREGMPAWDCPDPSRPPRVMLNAGLGLVIDGVAGDWALVRAVNGWKGWVDGRRLWPRP
jgi:hypothetical protein